MAVCQATKVPDVLASSRAGSLPHFFGVALRFVYPRIPCGSGLARDGGVSGNKGVGCAGLIASRLAPTVVPGCHKDLCTTKPPVGASLLAMAVCQATEMLDVLASSRASPLPQLSRGVTRNCVQPNPLWERACPRWRCVRQQRCRMCWPHREQARSHRVLRCVDDLGQPTITVGASLLAMAACQATEMLDVLPSSRAASLPRLFEVREGLSRRIDPQSPKVSGD